MPRAPSHQRPLLSAAARRSLLALAAVEKRTPSALVRTLIADSANRRTTAAAHRRLSDKLEELHREVSAARGEMRVAVQALHAVMHVLTAGTGAQAPGAAPFASLDAVDRLTAPRGHDLAGGDDAGAADRGS